jgi:hypothetical protein
MTGSAANANGPSREKPQNPINSRRNLCMLHRACFQKLPIYLVFSGYALASLMTSNVVLTTALCLSMASTEQYFSSEIRIASLTAAASMS